MHMADALVSPAVGGAMWAVSGGLIAFCARKVKQAARDDLVPMMGVLGAFVFASQMVNFSIPGTGSSGHLGGGLILALLLGPYAALLAIASVLTVQALFFADGGLLALGCNIFNIGFIPAFVAYPFVYRAMAGDRHGNARAWAATVAAAVAGLVLGAFCVVLQTTASGISDLPFGAFMALMLPVHLAIGVVEGVATAGVVSFVARARPETLRSPSFAAVGGASARSVLIGLAAAFAVIGGVASWFASTHPDGLEWSVARVTGSEAVEAADDGVHRRLAALQAKTAVLPDYGFKADETDSGAAGTPASVEPARWPAVSAGTSVSGLVGGALTLVLACAAGLAIRGRRPR